MLEHKPGAELTTFRTTHRPDDASLHWFQALRLADHRLAYLQYEGPIGGGGGGGAGGGAMAGRGDVQRVAQGLLQAWQEREGVIECVLQGELGRCGWRGMLLSEGVWLFERME